MKETILVVDDDEDIRMIISMYLKKAEYQVITASSGSQALSILNSSSPDLIILDLMLPDIDGIEVCQEIRKKASTPIIFLSCKADPIDKSYGLSAGGDDYMSKPFEGIELIARVKAHLRRNQLLRLPNELTRNSIIRYPNLRIDLSSHVVIANEQEAILSPKEFQLLALLAQNPNVVFSSEQLFTEIWGLDSLGDYRTIMVHISNIRKKIELDAKAPIYIQTMKGVGYKFTFTPTET